MIVKNVRKDSKASKKEAQKIYRTLILHLNQEQKRTKA